MWVADQVDEGLQRYRERHGIERPWETRERIVVAVDRCARRRRPHPTGGPDRGSGQGRAARRARPQRRRPGLDSDDRLREHREVLTALGGSYHEVSGADIARALVRFAESHNATQIVLGASRRSRWVELTRGSIINDVNRLTREIDVHIIPSHDPTIEERQRAAQGHRARVTALSPRRRAIGWTLAVVLPIVVTLGLVPIRSDIGLPTDLLTYLLTVIVVATVGGLGPALFAAILASLLANWYFADPIHTFTIAERESLFAVFTFLAVARPRAGWWVRVGTTTAAAARARGEAETLAALAASSMDDDEDRLVEHRRAAAPGLRCPSREPAAPRRRRMGGRVLGR